MDIVFAWIEQSKYALLFLGAIFEGPVLMLASGFLIRLGQLELVPAYFTLMAGDFTADMVWYVVGRHGARVLIDKFGKFFNITPEIIAKIEKRFHTYHARILFISKITMGFGFALATLIVAGLLKINFKKYVVFNFLGGFIWTAFLLTVGYFFGNLYTFVPDSLKWAFLIIAAALIIYILWAINRYLVKTEI